MPAQVSALSPLRRLPSTPLHSPGATTQTAVLPKPANPLRRALWYGKMGLIRWLVQPYFDRSMAELQQTQATVTQLEQRLHTLLEAVNRPFECYALGDKAEATATPVEP
jgi:hypothetical protein